MIPRFEINHAMMRVSSKVLAIDFHLQFRTIHLDRLKLLVFLSTEYANKTYHHICAYNHISKKVIISKPHAAMPQEHHRLDYITLVVDVDGYGDTFSDRLESLVRLAFLCAMR